MSKEYTALASYYDALVKDESATHHWVKFVQDHIKGKDILEVACGSGEITNALHQKGYQITATDISKDMIELSKLKFPDIPFYEMDMRNINIDCQYDAIICFCDSFNYLNSIEEVKSFIQGSLAHLKEGGVLLFDMHTSLRLQEFNEEYIEEGWIKDTAYQWYIVSEDNKIYHHFTFYSKDKTIAEEHIQTVFTTEEIDTYLMTNQIRFKHVLDKEIQFPCHDEKIFYMIYKGEQL